MSVDMKNATNDHDGGKDFMCEPCRISNGLRDQALNAQKTRPETWNGGKLGALLKVGDIIHFPLTKIHRITELRPYTGPLAHLFPEGAQLASFDTGLGMTIDNSNYYD